MTRHEPILAPVYPSIGLEDLGDLLRKNGYQIEPITNWPNPGYQTLADPHFKIALLTPFKRRPGEYGVISLWSRAQIPGPVVETVLCQLRGRLTFAHVFADNRGCLVAAKDVVVIGGVTEYYLRDQFWYWSQDLNRVRDAIRKQMAAIEGRTLH